MNSSVGPKPISSRSRNDGPGGDLALTSTPLSARSWNRSSSAKVGRWVLKRRTSTAVLARRVLHLGLEVALDRVVDRGDLRHVARLHLGPEDRVGNVGPGLLAEHERRRDPVEEKQRDQQRPEGRARPAALVGHPAEAGLRAGVLDPPGRAVAGLAPAVVPLVGPGGALRLRCRRHGRDGTRFVTHRTRTPPRGRTSSCASCRRRGPSRRCHRRGGDGPGPGPGPGPGRGSGSGRRRGRGRGVALLPFDELVELAAVEPDPAALRAVVDLDALAVGHGEGGGVNGTVHSGDLLV